MQTWEAAMKRQSASVKKNKSSGFTLVELMMVITILMVLVIASGSSLFSTNLASERDGAVNALANIMTFARVNAMAHGVAYEVSILGVGGTSDTSPRNVEVYKLSSNMCQYPSFTAKPVKSLDLRMDYPSVTITKVHVLRDYTSQGSHVYFCFRPDGTVRSAQGNPLHNSDIVWNGARTGNGVQIFLSSFTASNGQLTGTESVAIAPYLGSPRVIRAKGNL